MRKDRSNAQKKRKAKTRWIILISVLAVLFISSFAGAAVGFGMLNKMDRSEKIPTNEEGKKDIGITPEIQEKIEEHKNSDHITTIALFGLDKREKGELGRSDSIILLSIDKAHKKIKMSSIMRDSYVNIHGKGMDKINHAYSFGGPALAIRTINENFHLNITDYASVDFSGMEKIIDYFGGLSLSITKAEVSEINRHVADLCHLRNIPYDKYKLNTSGNIKLNGIQAVAYTRVRMLGNGDFDRTERQRNVLEALMKNVQNAGPLKLAGMVSKLLPEIKTSISDGEILKIGTDLLTTGIKSIEQERFPVDGYYNDSTINDVYYLKIDLKGTKDQIHKYIFDDIKPLPKK